ncbi:hypothetical protein [Acidovorax carolinensis]|uniref:hypothetical protein n=1 Tax=Acidovorax carolinensis TaxID=553814 RepID=UPI0012FF9184|nr:hypothetical protein [Acidovorax carolinensis]
MASPDVLHKHALNPYLRPLLVGHLAIYIWECPGALAGVSPQFLMKKASQRL